MQSVTESNHKVCTGCQIGKPLADFPNCKRSAGGKLPKCRPCERARLKAWHGRRPGLNNQYQARYRRDNREKCSRADRRWREANPERAKETLRRSVQKYPHKRAARVAERYASRRKATPPWLTKEQRLEIELIYAEARELTLLTGIPHHVDHIMPLRGKTACGLHVPWNLQILPACINRRKGNRIPS